MTDVAGNGSKQESPLRRFLGLATGQRRGAHEPRDRAPSPPSPEELRDLALARLLRSDADGAQVLLELIAARSTEALSSAQDYVGTHALCAGFLGAQAALSRLHDDLIKLRG